MAFKYEAVLGVQCHGCEGWERLEKVQKIQPGTYMIAWRRVTHNLVYIIYGR